MTPLKINNKKKKLKEFYATIKGRRILLPLFDLFYVNLDKSTMEGHYLLFINNIYCS